MPAAIITLPIKSNRCPHEDIRYCPLYLASHQGNGWGCDDGRLDEGDGCAVRRGMDYHRAVETGGLAGWQRQGRPDP